MPSLLRELCDSVINSLESPADDFQNSIRELFCKMDESYKTVQKDLRRAEKLCHECRHILVVLRLFPLELKLAMDNLYKKTLCGFLSIYLDFKMMFYEKQSDKKAYFNNLMKEVFLLLGDEDKTCIWSVVVTSHTLNNIEILRLLACRFIEETKNEPYDYEQYIRMIWVLHVFFSQCKKANIKEDVARVLETALRIKFPSGLCKWMCHYFNGYGWKGLTDENVHETLLQEKQPKQFFKQVYLSIAKDDTLKYAIEGPNDEPMPQNIHREEDSSSQSSESVAGKKNLLSSKQNEPEQEAAVNKIDTSKKADEASKPGDEEEKTNNSNERGGDNLLKSNRVNSSTDADNKSDSSVKSSKSTKTSGAGRSKLSSATSFLDEEDDTLDAFITADKSNDDKESQGKTDAQSDDEAIDSKKRRANKSNDVKESQSKIDVQSDDEVIDSKKRRANKKKGSLIDESSADESVEGSSSNVPEKRSRRKIIKNSAPKLLSDSETDINTENDDSKEVKVKKTVKRKSKDDSDSDQTINGNNYSVDKKNGCHVDNEDDNASSVSSSSRVARNKSKPVKKVPAKRMKSESARVMKTTTERCEENTEIIDEGKKIIEEYMNGPYSYIFEEFEEQKAEKGEPFVFLENISMILPKFEQEATLADILHNNKSKQKKNAKKKNKKSIR